MSALTVSKPAVEYPEDDGLPLSDNTAQMRWIFTVLGSLQVQFHHHPDVFVAGNHLIYPIEGDNKTRLAPDVFVAFGRPKHDRSSYRVWEEDGVFPQVVFGVWSPSNRFQEMEDKRAFYEKYGAEEYYILYPEFPAHVEVWQREAGKLARVENFADWVSPRLGARFAVERGELSVTGPTGRRYQTPAELVMEADAARERAEAEKRRADEEARRREAERHRAEQERHRAEAEKRRAEKLAAKLRELGVDPDAM